MSSRTWFLGFLCVALGAACGDDGTSRFDENITVQNVSPVGSVGGLVLDAENDRPLGGVAVRIVSGGFSASATTDASGVFAIQGVPANDVVLATFEKGGYLSAQQMGAFVNAAGNYPLDNASLTLGPVGLISSTGTLSLYVFDEMGRPASGHELILTTRTRYLEYLDGAPEDKGSINSSALVGSSGLVRFTGLPDYLTLGRKLDCLVDIAVPPYDQDGDGYYEYAGGSYTFDVLNLGNPQPTIVLNTTYPGTLQVEASNVQALEGWPFSTFAPDTIPPVGPINVLFNLPVDPSTVLVSVWDEAGMVGYSSQVQTSGRSVTIRFPTALAAGEEYNLLVSATAVTGDRLLTGSFSAPFFVINEAATVTATVRLEDPLDPANLTRLVQFSEPLGFGLPGETLAGGNCVIFYDFFQIGPGTSSGNLVGDDPGELGNSSCQCEAVNPNCNSMLWPLEPLPVQPAGSVQSGYTKHWAFSVPLSYGTTTPVPPGTSVYLILNQVQQTTRLMRRANGQPVTQIAFTLPSS
ncbi:MAG: carboxypeptidase-like regulatory domain-containing protein [Polyangia bacterium]|jgi:hypothetical protein|nr:carboxypeptidase-like regulatory domain-containing protein [Polyangia bacterium]